MTLECGCPEHFPDWDNEDVDLGGAAMLELPIPSFLHMPMGYEVYLGRARHLVSQLELEPRWPDFYLTRTGWLRGRILAPLSSADSPSRHVKRLPYPFQLRGKLHQGDIGTIKNSVREMQAKLLDAGRMPKELYLSYLTCPLCQEQRGGAKILLLRRWEQSGRLSKRLKT
ncbi:hypothetical protein Tel_00515 [Candidatus Tenderia electrophaga]|jgi:hypothetical protein|uniref:Uncharacterized protein n=1 Tax=Candidatus Tenderia electrophaga TaxID=1748243 RepID=A0A0S2T9F2_9GAMM|nr:hypothetical protein Tel_00515 [Candidatus Tenderia electrophaga]